MLRTDLRVDLRTDYGSTRKNETIRVDTSLMKMQSTRNFCIGKNVIYEPMRTNFPL